MDNMDNMLDLEKPRIALSQSTVEFFSRLVLRLAFQKRRWRFEKGSRQEDNWTGAQPHQYYTILESFVDSSEPKGSAHGELH